MKYVITFLCFLSNYKRICKDEMTKREQSKECYAVKNIVKKYMSYIKIYTLHIYMLLKQGY